MSTLAGVATGLQAALLLARGKPSGLSLLATEDEPALAVAARSFWAAALCLPAFVCLQLIDRAQATDLPPSTAHGFALQLLSYVIDWAGFALLSRWLAKALGRGERWPTFIAAWNWCQVLLFLLLVVASLPPLLGLPDIIGETTWLVALGWGLWLEWYATKLALEATNMQAVGLVLMGESLSVAIVAIIQAVQG
jgi:hypothetical protein